MYLSTTNTCFFCLALIVKEEEDDEDEERESVFDKRCFSLDKLCKYLKINRINLKNRSSISLSAVKVLSCEACHGIGEQFTTLFLELERIQKDLDKCVRILHKQILTSSKNVEYSRRSDSDGKLKTQKLVDKLRKEILIKCPKIIRDKRQKPEQTEWNSTSRSEESEEEDENVRDPLQEEAVSSPLPSASRVKEEKDDDFDPLREDDDDNDEDYIPPHTTNSPDSNSNSSLPSPTSLPADVEAVLPSQSPLSTPHEEQGQHPSTLEIMQTQLETVTAPDEALLQQNPEVSYMRIPNTDMFQCKICSKIFNSRNGARVHYKSQHLRLKYKCPLCKFLYQSKHHLRKHMKVCEDLQRQKLLKKSKKKYVFSSSTGKYKCSVCSKTFTTLSNCTIHFNSAHPPKQGKYQCQICKVGYFQRKAPMKNHERICRSLAERFQEQNLEMVQPSTSWKEDPNGGNSEGEFPCPTCGKRFSSRQPMMKHIRVLHLNERISICPNCGQTFTEEKQLKLHLTPYLEKMPCRFCTAELESRCASFLHKSICKTIRSQEGTTYKCDICNEAVFQVKESLRRHKQLCKEGKGTLRKSKLILEQEAHFTSGRDADGKFTCLICLKKFSTKGKVKRHYTLVHELKKEFVCEICGKPFGQAAHLKDHKEIIHLGKTFACGICKKEWKSRISLKRHNEEVHSIFK